jgi:hypothetical protein
MLAKLDPMTVIGSAMVMMPEIITMTVRILPIGVTWLGLGSGSVVRISGQGQG